MPDRRSRDINYSRGRRGRPYERAKAACYARETHCARCGEPVDKSLPYRDPVTGQVNLWAKTFGHRTELDAGANPYDGQLEHFICNSRAGAKYGAAKRKAIDIALLTAGVDDSLD